MARRKEKDRARRRRAERKRKRGPSRSPGAIARAFGVRSSEEALPLDPPAPERCFAPVHVEAGLRRVADPRLVLGLDPAAPLSPAEVRAAWRRGVEAHPPEAEPDLARALTAARDRLLAPERSIERRLGVLRAPDPAAYGLPVDAAPALAPDGLDARVRLLGQLALYALLEEELGGEKGASPGQMELPF
ncbi:MAG: hypothetical protein AB1726_02570 [Planctomycetota bacterium]